MVRTNRRTPATSWRTVATVAMVLVCFAWAGNLPAQSRGVHYQAPSAPPPGAIGSWQLRRGGPLPGHFQPVEIKAPPGALISLAVDGQFGPPSPNPLIAGMLIGSVYRLRVTGIPLHPGEELFPTIEVIDRTYTPIHYVWRFPIPIELTQQDIDLALSGRFVTRVIYLEDPQRPLPIAQTDSQFSYDVLPGDNPLQIADGFGRPVAIVRLGGRLPLDPQQPDATFLYGSPPHLKLVPREIPGQGQVFVPDQPPAEPLPHSQTRQEAGARVPAGSRGQDSGFRMLDAGYKMQDAVHAQPASCIQHPASSNVHPASRLNRNRQSQP